MGKNKNVKTPTVETPKDITVESIEEQIKSANKMEETIVELAEKEIKEEQDAKKKSDLKRAILQATYINSRELLELKKRRAEEKVTKRCLEGTLEALTELKGGKITPLEYDKKINDLVEDKRKDFKEIDDKHVELVKELRDNFPNYYSIDWEYNNWKVNRRSPFGY